MNRTFLRHLAFMALGYALAVFVATTMVCIILGAPTVLPDNGSMGSFFNYLKDLPGMFMMGSIMTAMYGFPGWLISVITGEVRSAQGKFWYAIAGLLTALLAIFLSGGLSGPDLLKLMNFAILIGGFCGGLAYWAIAGKAAGNWKTRS